MRVKMRKIFEAAVIVIGTLGWWGFVYPELCLTEDAYEQEADVPESSVQKASEREDKNNAADEYEGFQLGEIRIKVRAIEYVYQVNDKELKEKELRYD